ncbi:MAG: cation diffusion facilitator family transporter [Desulfovibrionales bacterium]
MPHKVTRYAWLSIGASLVTLALKFSAYSLTNSMGLLSDALETLVNLAAGLFALYILLIARKPADETHAYGHGKAEYFAGGAEGILILLAAGSIVHASIQRFFTPVILTRIGPGVAVAALAALVNFVTARIMLKAAREHDSMTLEADAKHLLTDVWTSAGVIAGLIVILFAPPDWTILDPVIAILVALNITFTGVVLIKRAVNGLMDLRLPQEEVRAIEAAIRAVVGPHALYHGLRTRKSGARRFIDFHLLMDGDTTVQASHDLCCDIEREIHKALPRAQITIHVEPKEDGDSWDGDRVGGKRCPEEEQG